MKRITLAGIIPKERSSTKHKTGSWRIQPPVYKKDKCNKCGICWVFCPEAAIEPLNDGYFFINLDYCKGCGICARECPMHAIEMSMGGK